MKQCARRYCLAVVLLLSLTACAGEQTVYHQAELGESRTIVERLIREDGQDVNAHDAQTGWTPLQIAVLKGHEKMVSKLLELGANPNVVDQSGRTPLDQARAMNHDAIVGFLLAYGAEDTNAMAPTQTIHVVTTPPHARIILDGNYVGDAPVDVSFVAQGRAWMMEAYPPEDAAGLYVQRRAIARPIPERVLFDLRIKPASDIEINVEGIE